jgi:type IV secretion system protein VirB4
MQQLSSLTLNSRIVSREKSAGSHLPYARHVDERTIETRDGRYLQFIRLRGLLFETADTEELNYRSELRDAMLRSLGSSRFALYHHIIRREVFPDLNTRFADPFSADLDRRWRAGLQRKRLFRNDLILTIVRRPLQGRIGLVDRAAGAFRRKTDKRRAGEAGEIQQLTSATEALVSALAPYDPQVLRAYSEGDALCSEPLEFLSELFNGDQRPVLLPFGDIGDHLPCRRISFGQDSLELAPAGHLDRSFAALVSIKDYPGQTAAGMFDELLRLPFEIVVTQSFALVERQQALGQMNLAVRRMRSAEDEAISLRNELSLAKDEVAAGRAGYGEHHTTVMVRAPSLADLDSGVAEVTATLADLGIVGVREEVALEPAFWAQFPSNFKYVARRALVSTRNFAGLASLHNFSSGSQSGNHWGEAVTLLETTAAGPYFFNFHNGDLGNFTVIGPSGSGKTVILNFLLAQARRFDPRIIFFDKDRGAELFIRAIGGRYDRLRPGHPSGLNPLQLEDTPQNRQFLADWLRLLVGGGSVEDMPLITDAVDATFAQPIELRRLRHIAELFRGGHRPHASDLWSRLCPWWGDGEHAWLFDNERDCIDLSAATVGFDMTAILDEPITRTPAMFYLFHRVEERLDGKPSIIVVDEGWKALDDDAFVRRIKDWEKTIRKRNGIVGFATQSAQDALESRIASAIIEQAATQIFTINPKARPKDYIDGFGLTEHEFAIVRSMPDNSHCFLVKHGSDSAVVRLDLSGEADILTILSGRESTVRRLDEIIGLTGEDPLSWMPQLLERV